MSAADSASWELEVEGPPSEVEASPSAAGRAICCCCGGWGVGGGWTNVGCWWIPYGSSYLSKDIISWVFN